MDFEKNVLKTIEKHCMLKYGDNVVIGLSGGADSVALATVLCALKEKFNLRLHAAHVNHMIRGDEAQRDSDYAKRIANELGMEFHLLECNIPQKAKELGISEEMAGRQVRYGFFNDILSLSGGGKVAVAHHMGDSAETVIINMIRGASLNGLKGISPVNGNIIRPLIECSRAEIEDYLKGRNIPFMTDSTNAQNIYTRNIIRNEIIPLMEKINPNIIQTVCDNSSLLKEDEEFICSVCRQYEKDCLKKDGGEVILDFRNCTRIHPAVKRRLIMAAIKEISGSVCGVSSANIESVLTLPTGRTTFFGGVYIHRSYEKLIFSFSAPKHFEFSHKVLFPCKLLIDETGKAYSFKIIENSKDLTYENGAVYLDADSFYGITARNRKNGDSFSPLGLGGRKKVKDFLIDLKIPVNERAQLPIFEADGKIAAVGCLRVDQAFKVTDTTKKILKINEVRYD